MRQGLDLQGLSKSFKGSPVPALEEFSLSLAPGSCTAVLGPGSGKSTLLRTVAGLEIPDRGSVLLDGQDLAAVRPERRGMAMVFQRPLLFPHLNVLDNADATILMVTYDRDEAAAVADHLALISEGRLLQHSGVQEMYTRAGSLQVSRLMGGTNEVPGDVRDGVHYSALGPTGFPVTVPGRKGRPPWSSGRNVVILEGRGPGVPATVTRIRARGPRRVVTMEASGVTLHAEASGGQVLAMADIVRFQFPTSAVAVVGASADSHGKPLTSPNWKVLA